MKRIYLDYNASHPMRQEVLEAMLPYFKEQHGNASSLHFYGQQARTAVDQARMQVAALIGVSMDEVIFTSGGTCANNLAIQGFAALKSDKKHIITTAIEHSSVLNTCKRLEKTGWHVSYVNPQKNGIVDVADIVSEINAETALITVMFANNETGMIQPIADIANLAKERGIHFHVDGVQALGKLPVNVHDFAVDSMSFSAHKVGGPQGVGALYLRRGVKIAPITFGGSQEKRYWPGTENVPGIVGFGEACQLVKDKFVEEEKHINLIMEYLLQELQKRVPSVIINNPDSPKLPNTLNLSFPGIESDTLVIGLDMEGIAVSNGAACSSGTVGPSHVLKAMGLEPEMIFSAIRVSIGVETTKDDIDDFVGIIEKLVKDKMS